MGTRKELRKAGRLKWESTVLELIRGLSESMRISRPVEVLAMTICKWRAGGTYGARDWLMMLSGM